MTDHRRSGRGGKDGRSTSPYEVSHRRDPPAVDRLDIEELTTQVVNAVQFSGYTVKHQVEDPELPSRLLRQEARSRSLQLRTGMGESYRVTM